MNWRARVGQNVRPLQVTLRLTREALAVDAGLDRTHVGRIERTTENPTLDVLDLLATALKIESYFATPGTGSKLLGVKSDP